MEFTKAYLHRDSPTPANFTPDEQACLQSLYFAEMHWRKNDIDDPATSTCGWLLEHRKYRDWLGQGHGLLWIKGKPGAGKSTLLKHALETEERKLKQGLILASFFFHGRGTPIQRSVIGLFRSLLHQILQQNRELLSEFTSIHKKKCDIEGPYGTNWNWHENQLQKFFKSYVVDTARTYEMRIYVDALDECGEDTAHALVEFFRHLSDPISICFSCRHYPIVALECGNELFVEDENKQDIETYVRDKIEAHIQKTHIAKAVLNEIVSRAQGNFQWVVLVMPRIIKVYKSRQSMVTIQTMIKGIPAQLNELYTELFESIEKGEKAQCLHLMQWMCFAFRPLTLTELRFALAVGADTAHTSIHQCQKSHLFVETDEDMEPRIRDLSKGLAEIRRDSGEPVVQFIHESVKDFLLEERFQVLDKSIAGTVRGRGHFWLSRSCIKFVSMEELRDSALCNRKFASVDKEKVPWIFLLQYSVGFWLDHVIEVENANMSQDDLAALDSKSTECDSHSWFAIYKRLEPWCRRWRDWNRTAIWGHTTFLHSASFYNLISVVRASLNQNVWVTLNHTDSKMDTPFSIAVDRGHDALVEMMLDHDDVDVNKKNSHRDTPLSTAIAKGHEIIVGMLLSRDDVDVNVRNSYGESPVSIAVSRGYGAILKMLLSRDDIDIISVNQYGDTPLCEAASCGQKSGVEFLLERVANHKSKEDQLANALLKAAEYGHYEIVQLLLLQQGCNADSKDHRGRTPLSYAAEGGFERIVKLLLKRSKVDVYSQDAARRTPLSYAAGRGHKEVVKLILDGIEVDVYSNDKWSKSPLSWALDLLHCQNPEGSYEDVVDLLLSRKDIRLSREGRHALTKFFANRKGKKRFPVYRSV